MTRLLILLLWLLPVGIMAAPFSGELLIDKTCPLFQSKNKGTNPGQLYSNPGQRLEIVERLGHDTPTWFRVRTSATQSPLRWIAADCGQLQAGALPAEPQTQNACNLADKYDSHLLALSWQNAFCESKGSSKPECRSQSTDRFDASHFSLHGLWPNKRSCGINYGYCGKVKHKPDNFCAYPAIELSEAVSERLAQMMPSHAYGSCLERHEWWKHGSCRDENAEAYFSLALRLTTEVNQAAPLLNLLQQNIGAKIATASFRQAFQQSFGTSSEHKLSLKCHRGMLTEIQLSLPEKIDDSDLKTLLQQAPRIAPGNCGSQIRIDAAN
ncbi:ribonuclease T(2) [Shewanella carassii]|uniref:ribonuclease T2 family protein n=1 Tax=Shewanella carassii TaxID=1987584 RepID=UPI001BEDB2DD|nr:ribonuclease T [Shewanella carassii]BCV68477.1 ribonuclease T(2) [Shewanella carassii]